MGADVVMTDASDLPDLSMTKTAVNTVLPKSGASSVAVSSTSESPNPSFDNTSSLHTSARAPKVNGTAALDDDEPDPFDSDDENDSYRLHVNPERTRKVTEKKRLDNEAFHTWMIKNAREETKASVAAAKPVGLQSVARMVTDSEGKNIISSPREYQTELFERAKKKNTIVVLDTGISRNSLEYHICTNRV